jgi:rhodanese-related sulfurtransferase
MRELEHARRAGQAARRRPDRILRESKAASIDPRAGAPHSASRAQGVQMVSQITLGYQKLLDEALGQIRTLSVEEARGLYGDERVLFVDLRDPRELEREGRIPGAFHCPRGMLEFWIDPASPYAKPQFQQDKTFVFFCAAGWRSALSTFQAQRMGLSPVAHIDGGFSAWKKSGAPVEGGRTDTKIG